MFLEQPSLCRSDREFNFHQVQIQPVAKYDWEHKYYYGRLIAVSSSFLVYAIKGESCEDCVGQSRQNHT